MNAHFIGQQLACILNGVHPNSFDFHKAASDVYEDIHEPNYGILGKFAATYAANMYEAAGKRGCFEFFLYDGLSKAAQWCPAFDEYTAPVFKAMIEDLSGAIERDGLEDQGEAVKSAGVMNLLMSLIGKGVGAVPTAGKYLMGAGAAGGAGLGALYWGLNRHSTEDEAEVEAMKERLLHYNRITQEISDDLKRNNAVDSPDDAKRIISSNTGTLNVTH